MRKILSLFMAVLMLCGVSSVFPVLSVSADDAPAEPKPPAEEEKGINYLTHVFASPEDKLATMEPMKRKGDRQLFADRRSGEVAVKDWLTGQILFTNPYDVGSATASDSIKRKILSQIIVKFDENGREKEYPSFEYAAEKDQIKVKNIKNGIRVEYTIGREEARHLVPRRMEKSRFETLIKAPLEEYFGITYEEAQIARDNPDHPLWAPAFYLCKEMAYYEFKSLSKCTSDRLKKSTLEAFPILSKMDIYVLDPTISATELEKREENIKTACPDYSYEEMDYDHQITEYESEDENPPVFKMALEYTLEADGFTVRLPANGVRFNESKFQLTNLSILPYMGAGNNAYTGYTFYPDGSGALFAFENLKDVNTTSVAGKIYGNDYAYHKISGTYQQIVRYPVFGIVENTRYYDCIKLDDATGETVTRRICGSVYDKLTDEGSVKTGPEYKDLIAAMSGAEVEEVTVSRGYVAVIEEGDALTDLVNYHAGVLSPYDCVQMNFNPRPKDSYNLADAISVGTNSEWTVVTERKYVGNYKIHYQMLTDPQILEEKAGDLPEDRRYEPTWLGMALAYRDYLVSRGLLTRLDAAEARKDIPLYIESFGALKVLETVASIPVKRMKALTTTKDIRTMYEDLSARGVTNINFKLTGFANGGLVSRMPYKLKWEKASTKGFSMQELLDYAASVKDGSLGIYPDFDFAYAQRVADKPFDGFSLRKHAVRTIDRRYANKRYYLVSQQRYVGYYQMAVSPAYYKHFYKKFMKRYLKYDNLTGISVASLGNALNSDFDKKEPYNREDARSFTVRALAYISGRDEARDGERLQVMVDGGNAYTWQYADHILNLPVDSSRFIKASYSVPFVGVVLHGYKHFAGPPLNMEGDIDYAKLKAIENGSSAYFTLSYRNTQKLKDAGGLFTDYYSVRYDIWQDGVVEIYNELNRILKDVQDKIITDHEFLSGMRVPDIDELRRDISEEFAEILDYQTHKSEVDAKRKSEAVADARARIAGVEKAAADFMNACLAHYSGIEGAAYLYVTSERSLEHRLAAYIEAHRNYEAIKAACGAEPGAQEPPELAAAKGLNNQALAQLKVYIRNISRAIAAMESDYKALMQLLQDAETGALLIKGTEGCPESIITEIDRQLENTRRLMTEQLGTRFDLTVDKAKVDTFIRAHIALLMVDLQTGAGSKVENLYRMIRDGAYGLSEGEIDLLRFLPANSAATDADLKAKYGLTAKHESVDGLIRYVKELLGDGYQFDPLLDDGIDAHIRAYFTGILHSTITGMSDKSILPDMNFVPTHLVNKRAVSNSRNINEVLAAMKKVADRSIGPALAKAPDGCYDLETVLPGDAMDELVAAVAADIQKRVEAEKEDTRVEYATPETMEADIREFLTCYYYKKALELLCVAKPTTLKIRTVLYKTDASVSYLADLREAAYGPYKGADQDKYHDLYNRMMNDHAAEAQLRKIAEAVGAYGDVYDELVAAYRKVSAARILGKDKEPKFSSSTKLNGEVADFLEEQLPGLTVETLESLIQELTALVEQSENKPDDPNFNIRARAERSLLYALLKKLSEEKTDSYYYDPEMIEMDRAVRGRAKGRLDAIRSELGADATVYEFYDRLFASLSDRDDPLTDFVRETAARITRHVDGKGSIPDDVQAYYCYLLFNSCPDLTLGTSAPDIPLKKTSATVRKNAIAHLNKDLDDLIPELMARVRAQTQRGEIPNYALSALLTDEERDRIVKGLFDSLYNAKFVESDEEETLLPALRDYFEHAYCTAVLERMNAKTLPAFHVSEIYGDDLYTAGQNLKALLRYFVTTTTDITEQDIESMIGGAGSHKEKEKEEDVSRYLSDDGRIVAVTYGDKTETGYVPFKTFILNYNNFSADVTYHEVTYTIPAYGYVVVVPDADRK